MRFVGIEVQTAKSGNIQLEFYNNGEPFCVVFTKDEVDNKELEHGIPIYRGTELLYFTPSEIYGDVVDNIDIGTKSIFFGEHILTQEFIQNNDVRAIAIRNNSRMSYELEE